MRFLGWRWLALVMLMVVGASCGGNGRDFPDEDDVPQEALVVMPGAMEVGSKFTQGRMRNNIHGPVMDYGSSQRIDYEIDGVTGRDVYEFYLAELSDKGWEFYAADGSGSGERGGEPGQCRIGAGGYCGQFKFLGPEGPDDGIGVIHYLRLTIHSTHLGPSDVVDESGAPILVEHIDDEIDGFRISISLGFAPSESCVDWEGPAWGVCAG